MTKINEIEVYQAYILAKQDPKRTVSDVANSFGITRNAIYEVVRRIEGGNASKIRKCKAQANLDCLWEYKYKARFLSIPKNREKITVEMLKNIIKEMKEDGFTVTQIARRTGKDRSTVLHHLSN